MVKKDVSLEEIIPLINREKHNQISRTLYYIFKIENDIQVLFFFGVQHTRVIEHPQFRELKNYWEEFKNKTKPGTRVVFIESHCSAERLISENITSFEEAISKRGEPGATAYLAKQENVSAICPEPDRQDLFKHLQEHFSNDEILTYYVAIKLDHWNREGRIKDLDLINDLKQGMSASLASIYTDLTMERIECIFETLLGRKSLISENIDEDRAYYNNLSNPNKTTTISNRVARASSDIRDAYLIKAIVEEWRQGNSIFITYGSGHAYVDEDALRKLLV